MPKRKPSPTIAEKITRADAVAETAKRVAGQTREAQNYDAAMCKYAQTIRTIIEKGTLAEKVEVERTLLERDLFNANDDPRLVKEAEEAIANFKAGMVVYDRLTTEPEEYRKYADGFMPKHRTPEGVPKDEMHNVLRSQNSRESQRDSSRHNTDGEEALVAVRKVLLAAIERGYAHIQETVLAGGEPPEGAARNF